MLVVRLHFSNVVKRPKQEVTQCGRRVSLLRKSKNDIIMKSTSYIYSALVELLEDEWEMKNAKVGDVDCPKPKGVGGAVVLLGPYWGVGVVSVLVRPSSNDEDSLRVGGMGAVGVLENWACSDERETGVQWRPFPGFYINILRHDREQGC